MAASTTPTFTFRPVRRDDSANLKFWLSQPHVHRWWYQGFSDEAIEAEFGPMFDDDSTTHGFIISVDDVPVGFIQYYFFRDEPSDAALISEVFLVDRNDASIDYFIGDPLHIGRGIGRQAIAAFCDHVRHHHADLDSFIVAIHADNPASWKCLEHAGFSIVGYGDFDPDNPNDSREHVVLEQRKPL